MGRKHKHSKDKLYKTVSELTSHHVGANRELELSALHRRLKFDTCCLSLNNVTTEPMGLCDQDGFCYVFECDLIIRFLEKFNQIHPITGQRISAKDLIKLKFHKDNEGLYHCPVTLKPFNQYSKIVANKKSGHVYSWQAYHDMNATQKCYEDLITGEPFNKSDIVTIQEPNKAETKWNVTEFYYVKHKLRLDDDTSDSKIRGIDRSSILKSSLEEYEKRKGEIVETFNRLMGQDPATQTQSERLDHINSAAYSDGTLSSSVTSTVAPVAQTQRAALLTEEQIIYPKIKKRAHVQLLTNFGPINLELYCDRTPKTCHNFLMLVSRHYYDQSIFHRLIKNFIMQGGDPTGTGSGGRSAWGEPFQDEFCGDLKHEGRGVVAMANSGPNTNQSQFYITLRGTWDHLDKKHTVFGRVVGGMDTLDRIESEVETDKNDRPKKEIKILRATKYSDPFEEVQAAIAAERRSAIGGQGDKLTKKRYLDSLESSSCPTSQTKKGVGRASSITNPDDGSVTAGPHKADSVAKPAAQTAAGQVIKLTCSPGSKGSKKSNSYGNFDNW